ncbi:MAG: sensor histidine kinase [Bacteroidia bacterium]|nr:sensor histidine kinase [Bacteroidota bacterium]MBP6427212.1 sensor histidine kinase [Bacteroidia bacterium]MBP6658606.1 sensor histidine kinase [Bacteroidia bacterium]
MSRKYIQIFLHVLACFAFLAFAVLLAPGPEINSQTITNPHTLRDIISYFLIFLFFYLNFYFLLPKYYFKKKHFRYIFSVLFSFALVIIVPRLIFFSERHHIERHQRFPGPPSEMRAEEKFHHDKFPMNKDGSASHEVNADSEHNHPMPPPGRRRHSEFYGFDLHHLAFEATQSFILFIFVILFSLVIKTRNKLRSAEKEKLNAELSYLKAQINPHFLFNTLNSIYSLAIEKSDYTPTAVVKLSGMMRYVLTESSAQYVSLEKEINYIRDFVDLQKLRAGDTADVQFDVSGDFIGNRIAPLILIAFIENAFKHGVNPEEKSVIVIRLVVTGKKLHLIVKNNKVNLNSDLSNQVGLENTINRLDLIYPSKYTLHFRDKDNEYRVELILELI